MSKAPFAIIFFVTDCDTDIMIRSKSNYFNDGIIIFLIRNLAISFESFIIILFFNFTLNSILSLFISSSV